MNKAKRYLVNAIVISMWSSAQVFAVDNGFNIRSLPKGKEVTLPRTAMTYLSGDERVIVGSTDIPQTLKVSNNAAGKDVRIAIYDSNADKVKRIIIKPQTAFLYHFKNLGTISLVPEQTAGQTIVLESNKPLSVSR